MKAIAADLGVERHTVSRWGRRDDFKALVREHREALMPETPSAEHVLTQALSAVKENGHPDWSSRIAAAKAIMSTPVASDEAQAEARETLVYLPPPEDGDGARPNPRTDPFEQGGEGGGQGAATPAAGVPDA